MTPKVGSVDPRDIAGEIRDGTALVKRKSPTELAKVTTPAFAVVEEAFAKRPVTLMNAAVLLRM